MPVNVQVNPLDSLIQGFQVGQQLTPAAIQQRNLSNQLALQLQQVQLQRAQQQLNDYLHPENALSRQIQGQLAVQSLNPISGVVAAPAGLAAETIATPKAVGVTEADLLNQEASGVPFQVPTAAPGSPITPIIGIGGNPTGFSRDLNSALEGALQERQLQNITNPPQAKAYSPGSYVATPEQLASGTGFTVPKESVAPKPFSLNKGEKLFSATGELIAENPSDAPKPFVVPSGGVVLNDDGTVKFRNDKTEASTANQAFQIDALDRSVNAIDDLIARTNDSTTGRAARLQGSSLYPAIAQTDAYVNYGADLDSVKSGVFLTQIAAMKASSKSGSAGLGAISNKEGDRLESAYASLRQNQSPENIKKNLRIAKDAIQKYRDALTKYGNAPTSTPNTGVTTISTKEQFDALPPGSAFIFNGKPGTKNK